MFLSALARMNQDPESAGQMYIIPDGKQGTFETLKMITKIVHHYKKNPVIRDMAIQLTTGLPQKDYRGEVQNIFLYVRDQIRYVQDIEGTETLHTPDLIIQQQAGDCDDKCILLASLLMSINHPCCFVACGFIGDGGNYSHVYTETYVGTVWVPLETTEPVDMGWEPPDVVNRLEVYC